MMSANIIAHEMDPPDVGINHVVQNQPYPNPQSWMI